MLKVFFTSLSAMMLVSCIHSKEVDENFIRFHLEDKSGIESKMKGSNETIYLKEKPELTTSDIARAEIVSSPVAGPNNVQVVFTESGRSKLAKITAENIQKRLAILIQGTVYMAPIIQEKIEGGRAIITLSGRRPPGDKDITAQELVRQINEMVE